jgi:hypothetical protein
MIGLRLRPRHAIFAQAFGWLIVELMAVDSQTMRTSWQAGVWVIVQTARPPRDEEWSTHCAEVLERREQTRGVLVLSMGGGPSSRQRAELRTVQGRTSVPTALLTDSTVVGAMVMSLNWFSGESMAAAFATSDLSGALKYLVDKGATMDGVQIARELHRLARALDVQFSA